MLFFEPVASQVDEDVLLLRPGGGVVEDDGRNRTAEAAFRPDIDGGLAAGEEVVVSPLTTVVEGMAVRTVRDDEEPNQPRGALAEEAEGANPVAAAAR